jgi:nucleoside transporter
MTIKTRWMLAAMMFLEYAVWGAWTPILSDTLGSRLHATGTQVGMVYGVLWLACIITPFIGGQLVDRYMPSQIFLGVAHLIGAYAAWMMSQQTDIGGMITWMWVWSLLYAPTLGITNSIVFHHLSRSGESEVKQERDFSVIRTAGTIGWIVAGFLLTGYLMYKKLHPAPAGAFVPFEEMQVTAVFALILGVLAILLPHTPPSREAKDPWAFTKAFALFKLVPGFAVFMLISFVVSTEFQFFYVLSAPFLTTVGVTHDLIPVTKAVSQVAEIVCLAIFLPISLKYLGMRKTLVIGTLAWPVRYFIFALQKPLWLVIASLAMHGFGFAFVFVTSYIYVDRVSPKDIRASAQSLLTLVTLGFGNYLGTLFCGRLKDHYTTFVLDRTGQQIPGPVNWPMVFMVPGVLTFLCAIAFWLTFREPASGGPAEVLPTETVGAEPPITALEPQ